MKVLLVTPYIPWPLSEGGKISQYAVIDALRKKCSVTLAVAVYTEQDEKNVCALTQLWPDVSIKKIELKQPQHKPGTRQRVNYFIGSTYTKLRKRNVLQNVKENNFVTDKIQGVNILQVKKRAFIDQLLEVLEETKPDIVQVDILDYIDLALMIPHDIKKVFVHHELRFGLFRSFFANSGVATTTYDEYIIELTRMQELMFLNLYDGVIVFSEEDRNKLLKAGIKTSLCVSPFPILDAYFIPITDENAQITKLVFAGGENHAPNKDGVEWYINEIAVSINKVRKIVLHVTGEWSEAMMNKYKGNPYIHFAGYVEDFAGYCKRSIMLVPLRSGSGVRTKILYAMAQGMPVISTVIGCEGIDVKDGESILIADTPVAFAEAFKTIVDNAGYTTSMVQAAQQVMKTNYSQEHCAALRMQYFKKLLND
jgi:glycosyltransferase involved in cell wall biosynthesis